MAQLQNLVKLDDGIIFYTQAGDQSRVIAENSIAVIRLLAGGMSVVKLLADYSDTGDMDEEAIQKGFLALETLPLDKVAIIGASPYLKELVTEMARNAGKSKIIHFAKDREEAVRWLNRKRS